MIERILNRYTKKKIGVFLGDLFVLFVAVIFSLSFYWSNDIKTELFYEKIDQLILYVFCIGVVVVTMRYYNLYKESGYLRIKAQLVPILKSIMLASILIVLFSFFSRTPEIVSNSRSHLVLFFFSSISILWVYRYLAAKFLRSRDEKYSRRILAIGAGHEGERFVREIKGATNFINIVGFVDEDESKLGIEVEGVKVLGTLKDIKKIVREHEIEEVFITIHTIPYEELMIIIEKAKASGKKINLMSAHFGVVERKFEGKEYLNLNAVTINTSVTSFYPNFFKRGIDIIGAVIIIVILMPFFIIVSLLIKLTSRGPVLYKTSVVGKDAEEFFWYKFRTMKAGNDDVVHKKHLEEIIKNNMRVEKIKNDKRITFVGRFLRKFSLDELPQLINVLKGQMSLVGPRPCLPYEFELMDDWHKRRTAVTPGMSGLWQIAGRNRNDVSFNDSLILDLWYVDNISMWLDFKIVLKTVPVVIFGRGGA